MIFDADDTTFREAVLERSAAVPVVVDFWAAWCGPCRQLTPALESAAAAREGRVDLAKVDVDANPLLSQTYRVQGIPAVKAFRDGKIASEFTGAVPPAQVERFFDALVPSEADELAGSDDESSLRRALELDPRQSVAAGKLARLLLARGETDEALAAVEAFPHDFVAAGLAARARLSQNGHGLEDAFAAWDRGDHATALEDLQTAFAAAREGTERDAIRQTMVAIFTELGPDDPLAREHRRRLSAAIS
ncbi:MAG: FIG000875: Thioredoxin domain-containing protein EC-YbbN [uncultured Solirubrobacterales bacterium]|uniref:FIG000875: Thioredoxin domain-containing protein EC-YbbN n=1 Tax=uncultured Solirubrobacterales bacterium TaxID=768556 RepID=A0A6J4TBE7_9ACTN|nr:MAG: FIG000875: Thioredoxin domain-containing protein EC-YbbN [uncultured Solirubrobacterales bacterium]